jgi:hypothetical protein
MKISIGKASLTVEADMSKIESTLIKTIPEKIKSYLKERKNIRQIELSIKQLRNECFGMMPKKYKYKRYSLPVPRTPEQIKQESEYRKYVDEKTYDEFFEKRLEEDTIEHTMLERFYDENGGIKNFSCFYQKGIKIDNYTLQPFKTVYTYSKKNKAVFINEQFRKSDNTYCLFGYCTKNFEQKKL